MNDKLELSEILQAVDSNVKELWDALDETQQKDFKKNFYTLTRYVSNVAPPLKKWPKYVQSKYKTPTREEQEHFVLTVNEYYNKHWNTLQDHPKLLWLLLCICHYDTTPNKQFFHEWLGLKRVTVNKKTKILADIYPNKKLDEIEMLSELMTNQELISLAKDYGMDEKVIAKQLK